MNATIHTQKISNKTKNPDKSGLQKGDNQIRTGDDGVADRSLTTWLCRRISRCRLRQRVYYSNSVLIRQGLFIKIQ